MFHRQGDGVLRRLIGTRDRIYLTIFVGKDLLTKMILSVNVTKARQPL